MRNSQTPPSRISACETGCARASCPFTFRPRSSLPCGIGGRARFGRFLFLSALRDGKRTLLRDRLSACAASRSRYRGTAAARQRGAAATFRGLRRARSQRPGLPVGRCPGCRDLSTKSAFQNGAGGKVQVKEGGKRCFLWDLSTKSAFQSGLGGKVHAKEGGSGVSRGTFPRNRPPGSVQVERFMRKRSAIGFSFGSFPQNRPSRAV